MTLAEIKQELDRTILFCNDLYTTRIRMRADDTGDIPASDDTLNRLQRCCDDFCTALADVIKES